MTDQIETIQQPVEQIVDWRETVPGTFLVVCRRRGNDREMAEVMDRRELDLALDQELSFELSIGGVA